MRCITVHFEDGNHLTTNINGTNQEIEKYYIGQFFDFGDSEEHPSSKLVKAIRVDFRYFLKVDYYKDMGTGEKLIRAGDEIEIQPATKQNYYKVKPLGALNWCNELVHKGNIEGLNA